MNPTVVVTSINSPTKAVRDFADSNCRLIVIGDTKTPAFDLNGCEYYSIEQQLKLPFEFAKICPTKHYARKNIGYLLAMNSYLIVETDDDNIPLDSFWNGRYINHSCDVTTSKWSNVYHYFCDEHIWPRGFPLDKINDELLYRPSKVECPIQQGLADDDPDVDAIYRLIFNQEVTFFRNLELAVGKNCWCPFNSQNTTWFPKAYPLMYLPMTCSWRACDIWRGFVAQRILWANDWNLLFHSPTVRQERNKHDLMVDFKDELSCYTDVHDVTNVLSGLSLDSGEENIPRNMLVCYTALSRFGFVKSKELELLSTWLDDVRRIRGEM